MEISVETNENEKGLVKVKKPVSMDFMRTHQLVLFSFFLCTCPQHYTQK